MKGEYEGKYSIVWDDCDVEMDLYASLDCEGDCCSELTTVTKNNRDAYPFKDDVGSGNRFFYPVRR